MPAQVDRGAVQGLAARYKESEHWALRALILLALGDEWHPDGTSLVTSALRDKDRRLQAFAVEALRRTDRDHRRVVLTVPVLDELVQNQLRHKSALHRGRVEEVLEPLAAEVTDRTQQGYAAWWYRTKRAYAPTPWTEAPAAPGREQTVAGLVERAFDLNAAGLEVAIVIDSTSSMQPTIDSARAALDELVALLHGIAPKLRLGVVEYHDFDVTSAGAGVVAPLSANVPEVIEKLGAIRAKGGGDTPERVEKGLELALAAELGWAKATNKLVVLIGDAPPHDEDVALCQELVQKAREHPFTGKAAVTGPKGKNVRSFVTSTIAIGRHAARSFRSIAQAGGGTFTEISVRGQGNNDAAVARISEHVLTLCFGSRFEAEIKAFVALYREYERDGFFK